MGQGRHIRTFVACLLAVAGAIQGITPDARDLCSQAAIRLVLVSVAGPDEFRDEDNGEDEVCLIEIPAAPLHDWHQQASPASASAPWINPRRVDPTSVMASRPGAIREIISGFELLEALCRLRC